MWEESNMDKKFMNRSSQPQSRATAVDCNKKPDSTHKPWPRNNKKREGSGNTFKNDHIRKSTNTQRGRGQLDRRPRTRGPPSTFVGGAESTRLDDDDEPEIGSVFSPGSKKQNLNHLLNFMYPSRGSHEQNRGPPQRRHQLVSYKHEHDLYLRAYCQFVVKEDGDYKINKMDPDIPVKWDQIEEIIVRSTGKTECPICLGQPIAARVGHCSHVYCWACILHYATTHDRSQPPCPVCASPLNTNDMKPAKVLQWDSPTEQVTMRLVRRLRGSTVVEVAPARGDMSLVAEDAIMPLSEAGNAPYAKMFSASNKQIQEILQRETKELNDQIMDEIDTTEIVFIEQALAILKKKEELLNQTFSTPKQLKADNDENIPAFVYEKQMITKNKIDWFDVNDNGDGACAITNSNEIDESSDDLKVDIENLQIDTSFSELNVDAKEFKNNDVIENYDFPLIELEPSVNEQTTEDIFTDIDKKNQSKYFYFYQADDGQQVFLHSVNVRLLNASWGALVAAPLVLHGNVLHRDTISLTHQTRKHMPYTAHLPLHCSVDIVELELQYPDVTYEALKSFSEELNRRARIRARHLKDELRRERAYRRAIEGPPKPDVFSEALFPPAPVYLSPPSDGFVTPEQASPSTTSVASPSPSGLSFAKMASASGTWRVRKPPPSVPAPSSPPTEEGSAPRTLSLSDAIEAAILAGPATTSKKNKKSKHKVLFATGVQRTA